jgi:subtilase family serine protease
VQVTRSDLRSTVSDPPATASQGSAFRVVDTVTNHGLIAAGMSRTLYYLSRDLVKTVDDQPLSQTRSVPALMPGASSQGEVVVKVPSKTPVGLHYLLACTDENSTVAETDEANNCGASATQVNIVPSGSGTPNLTPYKPSGWSDRIVVAKTTGTVKDATPLRAADTLYVDWAITNDGNAPTAAPFYTELYVDGVLRNAWLTSSLDAKGQFSVLDYAIGTLSPGNHTITIKTDATSVLAEKSKSDNTYTKTIKIAP